MRSEDEITPILAAFYEKYDMQVVETKIIKDDSALLTEKQLKKERKRQEKKERKDGKPKSKSKSALKTLKKMGTLKISSNHHKTDPNPTTRV